MVKKSILDIDPSEIVLHEAKKHPIGLFVILGVTFMFLAVNFLLLFIIASNEDLFSSPVSDLGLAAFFIATTILVLLVGYIAQKIYRASEIVVTNENLIQIIQTGLLDRKVSQLNLAKIQDVTANQKGFLPTLLGYGTLNVETAGEASNYAFGPIDNPSIMAKHINEAHDQYLVDYQKKQYEHMQASGVQQQHMPPPKMPGLL